MNSDTDGEFQVLSLNVGRPQSLSWNERTVRTAIIKRPVDGPVALRALGFEGDRQADLRVHGGAAKAAYIYWAEHYEFWARELPNLTLTEPASPGAPSAAGSATEPLSTLPFGAFGENLTIAARVAIPPRGSLPPVSQPPHSLSLPPGAALPLLENEVFIGDRFCVGEAEVAVTQPRLPCQKLAVRFGRADMIERFLASGRSGFYVGVVREGAVRAGDSMTRIARDPRSVSVAAAVRLYARDAGAPLTEADRDTMRRALEIATLPQGWRDRFAKALA